MPFGRFPAEKAKAEAGQRKPKEKEQGQGCGKPQRPPRKEWPEQNRAGHRGVPPAAHSTAAFFSSRGKESSIWAANKGRNPKCRPAPPARPRPQPASQSGPCEAAARAVQASQQRIGRPVKPKASPWAKILFKAAKAAGSAPRAPQGKAAHAVQRHTGGPEGEKGRTAEQKEQVHNSSPARFENRASIKRAGPMGRRLAVQGWCGSKFQSPWARSFRLSV